MFQVFTKRSPAEPVSNPPLERHEPKAGVPKIGLALSGGAARGWAHIGVVKTLVKNGVVPEVVAGTSIGANIEEARASQSRRDLRSRFAIALKEARETKYWLRLLVASDMVPPTTVAAALQEADELVAVLTVSVRRLKEEAAGS